MDERKGPLIVLNPGIMGGRPLFRGTRVPVEVLFENLADGLDLDEILRSYPTLDREDARAALMHACDLLKAGAGPVTAEDQPTAPPAPRGRS